MKKPATLTVNHTPRTDFGGFDRDVADSIGTFAHPMMDLTESILQQRGWPSEDARRVALRMAMQQRPDMPLSREDIDAIIYSYAKNPAVEGPPGRGYTFVEARAQIAARDQLDLADPKQLAEASLRVVHEFPVQHGDKVFRTAPHGTPASEADEVVTLSELARKDVLTLEEKERLRRHEQGPRHPDRQGAQKWGARAWHAFSEEAVRQGVDVTNRFALCSIKRKVFDAQPALCALATAATFACATEGIARRDGLDLEKPEDRREAALRVARERPMLCEDYQRRDIRNAERALALTEAPSSDSGHWFSEALTAELDTRGLARPGSNATTDELAAYNAVVSYVKAKHAERLKREPRSPRFAA